MVLAPETPQPRTPPRGGGGGGRGRGSRGSGSGSGGWRGSGRGGYAAGGPSSRTPPLGPKWATANTGNHADRVPDSVAGSRSSGAGGINGCAHCTEPTSPSPRGRGWGRGRGSTAAAATGGGRGRRKSGRGGAAGGAGGGAAGAAGVGAGTSSPAPVLPPVRRHPSDIIVPRVGTLKHRRDSDPDDRSVQPPPPKRVRGEMRAGQRTTFEFLGRPYLSAEPEERRVVPRGRAPSPTARAATAAPGQGKDKAQAGPVVAPNADAGPSRKRRAYSPSSPVYPEKLGRSRRPSGPLRFWDLRDPRPDISRPFSPIEHTPPPRPVFTDEGREIKREQITPSREASPQHTILDIPRLHLSDEEDAAFAQWSEIDEGTDSDYSAVPDDSEDLGVLEDIGVLRARRAQWQREEEAARAAELERQPEREALGREICKREPVTPPRNLSGTQRGTSMENAIVIDTPSPVKKLEYSLTATTTTTQSSRKGKQRETEAERQQREREEREERESEASQARFREEKRLEAVRLRIAEELEAEELEKELQRERERECQRGEAERLEAERFETERAEAERLLAAERAETQRLETQRADAERLEAARLEAERVEAARIESERIEAQRIEKDHREAERIENGRLEAERLAAEKERKRVHEEVTAQNVQRCLEMLEEKRKREEAEARKLEEEAERKRKEEEAEAAASEQAKAEKAAAKAKRRAEKAARKEEKRRLLEMRDRIIESVVASSSAVGSSATTTPAPATDPQTDTERAATATPAQAPITPTPGRKRPMSAAARAAAETPKATVSCTSSSSTPGTQATPRAATSAPRPSSTPAPSAARPRLTHRRRSNLPARPTLDGLSRQPGVLDLVLQNLSFRDLLAFSGTCRKYQAHVRANLRNLVISGRIIEGSRKTTLHFGTVSGYRLFSAPLDSCVRECVGRIRSARALDVITYLKRHCGEVTLTINGHVPSSGSGYHLLAELIALLGDRIIYQKYEPTLQGSMLSISFGSRDVVLADNWRTSVPQMAVDGNSVVENLIYPITGAEGSMKSMTMVKKVRHLVLDFTHWSASNAYARADQAMATTPNSSSPSPSRLQRIAHYAVTALRNGAKDVSIAALDEVDIEWLDPALVPKDGKRAPHVHLSFTRAFRSECDRMRRLNMLPNLNTNTNTGVNFYYRGHDFLKRFQSLDNE